jgi:tetratricopeptide (TPR) repeat protein
MLDGKTLCLNMIVKNEAHIIEKTLENICHYFKIDYWVISDTGSSDNTKDIITNFFATRNIQGELVEHDWRDFAFNRTKAIECAYNKSDYLLFWDADEKMTGEMTLTSTFDKKMIFLKKDLGITYYVPLLVSNKMKWNYKGVLHEYLNNIDPISPKDKLWVEGPYSIIHEANGSSHNDPDKYMKHGEILETAFKEEEDTYLKSRYAFYCAQSYKDANNYDKAIEWYTYVAKNNNNWRQEKIVSCLMLGKLYFIQKSHFLDAILFLEKGMKMDPSRPECISYLMEYYYINGAHAHVMSWFYYFTSNKLHEKITKQVESEKLFLDNKRLYYIYYYASICAYYIQDFETGKSCIDYLTTNDEKIPDFMKPFIKNNQIFYT